MSARECTHCSEGKPIHFKSGKSTGRCADCHKEKNRLDTARRRREKRHALVAANDESTGRKVCSKCLHSKLLSEYSPRKNSRGGSKLNKLCDTCLSAVYLSPARRSAGFDEGWWRQRAYTCNTAGRQALAKRRGVEVAVVGLGDLDYVCKPQDLLKIFDAQDGECHYCTDPLRPDATSIDHATPLCRGGEHHYRNFRIACYDCNHLKFRRTESEFKKFLRAYIERCAKSPRLVS